MESILIVVHLLLAIGLVGLVLIQHGKGADMGAAFGSGASATVFGSKGAGNFLSRTTGILAALFFATSLALAYYAMQMAEPQTLMADEEASTVVEKAAESDLPVIPETMVKDAVPVVPAEAPSGAAGGAGSDLPKIPE